MRSLTMTLLLMCAFAVYAEDTVDEASEDEGLTFLDLFLKAQIQESTLSPTGEFVAFFRDDMLVIGNPDLGYFDIREFNSDNSIEDLFWIGPSTVWVESWSSKYRTSWGSAVRFGELEEDGYGLVDVEDHKNPGFVSDRLIDSDDLIILGRPKYEDDVRTSELYEFQVLRTMANQLDKASRVDTFSGNFYYYLRSPGGEYSVGIRYVEGLAEVWKRQPGGDTWTQLWVAETESTFKPQRISADEKTMWVLSDAETDRIAAMRFDLEAGELGEILFQHERFDVRGILTSRDANTSVGVTYAEKGLYRYHFLDDVESAEFQQLQAHFPEQSINLTGYSRNSDARLVFASSSTERGSVHMCDIGSDQCELIAHIAPWLEGKPLSETIAMDVPSTDGIVVEAFLTLPAGSSDSIPLIAYPHGGPIGVSDMRHFNSEVQWFAHNGYAVLQVNYRGSGGYGESFEKAGLRQWGRGIEDDIEAAIGKVLADYPGLDKDRVGIFGTSYGGYSAMMSVIRNPELFKCAASFAGVMDLTLLFKDSSALRSNSLKEILIGYVGDPDVDYEEQTQHSPVYRYKDIKRPIFLGHGMADTVVDFEHSWRMQKVMRLSGTPPEFVLLTGVHHGFKYVDDARKLYEPLVEFLDKYLKPEVVEPASPPALPTASTLHK